MRRKISSALIAMAAVSMGFQAVAQLPAEEPASEAWTPAETAPADEADTFDGYAEEGAYAEPAPAIEAVEVPVEDAVPETSIYDELSYEDDGIETVVVTGSRNQDSAVLLWLLAAFFGALAIAVTAVRRRTMQQRQSLEAQVPAFRPAPEPRPAPPPPFAAPAPPVAGASPAPSGRDYFISHASENAAEAMKLVKALEEAGVRCWIAPRNIKAGQAYGDAIGAAVARLTKATLVLVSSSADESSGVKSELELARHYKRPIVPVVLNSHQPSKGMLYYIGTSHWLHFDNASPNTVEALIDALRD